MSTDHKCTRSLLIYSRLLVVQAGARRPKSEINMVVVLVVGEKCGAHTPTDSCILKAGPKLYKEPMAAVWHAPWAFKPNWLLPQLPVYLENYPRMNWLFTFILAPCVYEHTVNTIGYMLGSNMLPNG